MGELSEGLPTNMSAEEFESRYDTDADDAVVLEVIFGDDCWCGCVHSEAIFDRLRSMPDKGPLARALGITPSDLGLELRQFQWPGTKIDDVSWVEP